jgi:hypothetical protein
MEINQRGHGVNVGHGGTGNVYNISQAVDHGFVPVPYTLERKVDSKLTKGVLEAIGAVSGILTSLGALGTITRFGQQLSSKPSEGVSRVPESFDWRLWAPLAVAVVFATVLWMAITLWRRLRKKLVVSMPWPFRSFVPRSDGRHFWRAKIIAACPICPNSLATVRRRREKNLDGNAKWRTGYVCKRDPAHRGTFNTTDIGQEGDRP